LQSLDSMGDYYAVKRPWHIGFIFVLFAPSFFLSFFPFFSLFTSLNFPLPFPPFTLPMLYILPPWQAAVKPPTRTQQAPSNPFNPYQMVSRPDYKAPTAPSSLGQASQYSHSISMQISDPDTFTGPSKTITVLRGGSRPRDGDERELISGLQPQPKLLPTLSPKNLKFNHCKIKIK
jgi:hypothetical protein